MKKLILGVLFAFSLTFNFSLADTGNDFIDSISKEVQELTYFNDLYGSVMIAQASLETGFGKSQLGKPPYNNLFGIKGEYKGDYVIFKTREEIDGEDIVIEAKFRKYPSIKESMEDYIELMKTETYNKVWKSNTKSFKNATKFLTGKYATDSQYNIMLNSIIRNYGLEQFDNPPPNMIFVENVGSLSPSEITSYSLELCSVDELHFDYHLNKFIKLVAKK